MALTAPELPDDERRQRVLHLACCLLPKVNRDTMEILFTFLNWAASFHTVDEDSGSKMDSHNLATVIAPNILSSGPKAPDVDGSLLAVEVVRTLIECNESMCEVSFILIVALKSNSIRSPPRLSTFCEIQTLTPILSLLPRTSSNDLERL
jgi:RhoGAP domain